MEYYQVDLTTEQRDNLEKLWEYLSLIPEIDMSDFVSIDGEPQHFFKNRNDPYTICGTVCCLVGSGPFAGIAPQKDEGWYEYAIRAFGANIWTMDRSSSGYRLWTWLFSADWYDNDNTVEGGRTRIRIALDQGIPVNFEDQLVGDVQLCYTNEEDY